MKQVADKLREARDKISDPSKWIQGAFAARDNGVETDPTSSRAVCWCAMGAVDSVYPDGGGILALKILSEAMKEKAQVTGIAEFNDTRTHSEVIAAFDRAIELAEAAR